MVISQVLLHMFIVFLFRYFVLLTSYVYSGCTTGMFIVSLLQIRAYVSALANRTSKYFLLVI